MKTLNVVSLYDGISCGRVAIERAGYAVSHYIAYEIDKYPRSITRYNYPDTEFHGDVLDADFRQFAGYDLVIGGSPCTFWSIAKAGREVDKSGEGWKLFMCFVNAIQHINPKYYLYENVASMPATIKAFISEEFGCEPILINSALLSAQQRKRLYWTNIPNIAQPNDKGILLKDVLESGLAYQDKSHCITATYNGAELRNSLERSQRSMIAEPITSKNKTQTDSIICRPLRIGEIGKGGQGDRIYSVHGKTISLSANGGGRGAKTGLYKIDLPDGDYSIRKLTPIEAERCQTLNDNYTVHGIDDNGNTVKISNTQRYKSIGNAWTVDVISHMLKNMKWR